MNRPNYYISRQSSDRKKTAKSDPTENNDKARDKQKAIICMMAFSFNSVIEMN